MSLKESIAYHLHADTSSNMNFKKKRMAYLLECTRRKYEEVLNNYMYSNVFNEKSRELLREALIECEKSMLEDLEDIANEF